MIIKTEGPRTLNEKKINVYDFTDNTVFVPYYQRGYSYGVKDVAQIFDECILISTMSAEERARSRSYLNDFILYEDENKDVYIVDGQSRLMTLQLLIRALNDYIVEYNVNAQTLKELDIRYYEQDVQEDYVRFLKTGKSKRFTAVYKYLFKMIAAHHYDVPTLCEVVQNNVVILAKTTSDSLMAYEMFITINSKGKPLNAKEFIHSTLKQYSNRYRMPLQYDAENIVTAMASYYNIVAGEKKQFSNSVISDFLHDHVVDCPAHFRAFRDYLMSIRCFEKSTLYHAINNLHRDRVMKVAYALMASGRQINGSDEDVNKLLMGLINFSYISSIRGSNPSGSTGIMFNDVLMKIARGVPTKSIYQFVYKWISDNMATNSITKEELRSGLSRLSDKRQKSIMLLDIWMHNHTSSVVMDELWLEHACPVKAGAVWDANGWPTGLRRKDLVNNIGNKFLLNAIDNNELKNQYITSKGYTYKKAFAKDIAFDTALNHFDADRYEVERERYVKEREAQYVNFIINLPFGKLMVKR